MIKKFKLFESHEDIDPYGEEDWDNSGDYNIGDDVVCIDVNRSWEITLGKIYKVVDFDHWGDPKIICDNGKESYYVKDRFKKISENIHSDVDPYGEENWDEDEFNIGDDVVCLNINGSRGITVGKIYKVVNIDYKGNPNLINDNGDVVCYMKNRFEKVKLNENIHSDVDPYGEEDWEDGGFKIGDNIKCIRISAFGIVNAIGITNGKIYTVLNLDRNGDPHIINDDDEIGIYVKNRFIKVKLNENIHSDIDPYGEEEWDDDNDDFKIGDIIICTNRNGAYRGENQLYVGREYTVVDDLYGLTIRDNMTGKLMDGWFKYRFKKKRNI